MIITNSQFLRQQYSLPPSISDTIPTYTRKNLYLDVDDVVLDSSLAAIHTLKNMFFLPHLLPINKGGTVTDTPEDRDALLSTRKDWRYLSIVRKSLRRSLTDSEIESIFESDCFWSKVTFAPDFLPFISDQRISSKINIVFITKGTDLNHAKKQEWLIRNLPQSLHFTYIGLSHSEHKKDIHMLDGIQVDDNFYNLCDTDARWKILLTNEHWTNYNDYKLLAGHDDIYSISNLSELADIVAFDLENPIDEIDFFDDPSNCPDEPLLYTGQETDMTDDDF